MRSWNLKKFVEEYNTYKASVIWQVTRQAVEKAISTGRDIQVVEVNGYFEIRESKILNRIKSTYIHLDDVRGK